MAEATLWQEEEAATCRRKEDTTKTKAAKQAHQCAILTTAADTPSMPNQIMIGTPPASVIPPLTATNLNHLLSGHVAQEDLGADSSTSTIMVGSEATKENIASPKKKETRG